MLGAIGIVAATGQYMKNGQASVDESHDFLNASFSLESLSRDRMSREMVFTTLYPELPIEMGDMQGRSHKIPVLRDLVRRVPMTGGVLLRSPDMQSIEQMRATTAAIRTENPTAIVAADFEGGYIRFPSLSDAQKEQYKFPKKLFELREKEIQTYVTKVSGSRLGQFPSAEFLGKEYEAMASVEKRVEFLDLMGEYGFAVGLMMSDIGVHLILGPSFDAANSIGDDNEYPLSKNDRSFSTDWETVSAIGNAIVR